MNTLDKNEVATTSYDVWIALEWSTLDKQEIILTERNG